METWKPVVDYESHYSVSSLGRVMRTKRYKGTRNRRVTQNKVLKPGRMTVGYLFVALCVDGKPKLHSVHRLVAAAFIGPCPEGKEVNHKNGVRTDNRLDNLEYVTRQENIIHGQKHLPRKHTSLRGTMVPNAKLDENKVRQIKLRIANGEQLRRIGADYGVSGHCIWSIKHKKQWAWVE
jgi:hypothetical protein